MADSPHALAPAPLVAIPVALGLICELTGWITLAFTGAPTAAWYGENRLLVAVHLLALGLLVFPIFGMGWQLLSVIATRPPSRLARDAQIALTALAAIGAGGLLTGMIGHFRGAAPVALALPVALAGRALLTLYTVTTARGRLGTRTWLVGAELAVLGGITLGAALYVQRAGVPLGINPISQISTHAGLMALGWGGASIAGFAALLFPMFAIAREPPDRGMIPAALLWFMGLLTGIPLLFAAGAGGLVILLARSLHGRGPLGPGLFLAGAAQLGLLATVAAWAIGRPAPEIVAIAAALWILPLRVGVALRIVPFLVWAHWLSDHARTSPAPAALVPTRLAWGLVPTVLGGGILLVAGGSVPALWPVGAGVLAAGTLLLIVVLATILSRAFFGHLRAGGLAGTESP